MVSVSSESAKKKSEDRVEQIVVGGAIALALIVGFGLIGQKSGLLDGVFGPPSAVTVGAPVFAAINQQAGGHVARAQLSGVVASADASLALEKDLGKALPGVEVKNSLRVDDRAKDTKREIVRISVAADALNEAWPRPRFGDVKRLEVLWKDDKLTMRGAVYTPEAKAQLEKGFEALKPENRGAAQLREVVRPAISSAELQSQVSSTLASRQFTFTPEATIKADDPVNAEIAASLAPLLKDLRGLEILLSAGHADRATALKQAEAVKAALVAAGADATGLRPVPAPQNNPISFIVREKE
ncbi:MAG TPA: hypothetical protein VGF99_04610 [Myxococcota bacterium]